MVNKFAQDVHRSSSVEYLPATKMEWRSAKVKQVYDIQLGKMLQPAQQAANDTKVPYLKALHVQWGTVNVDELPEMWVSENEISKYEVINGDLLVCEGGEVGRSALLTDLQHRAIMQNSLHRIRSGKQANNRYLLYFMQQINQSGWFDVLCNKATIAHLTSEKLGDLRIYLPSAVEQVEIASFLDREIAKLDQLVDKKQRLIKLLQEKRQALITQAVTKGLDPNVPMKDSGIPWLGEVPEHWDINRMTRVAKMDSGHTPNKQEASYWDGDIPWVSLNDTQRLRQQDVITETAFYTTELGLQNSSAHLLPKNTVVFSRDATIGLCAILGRPMAVSQHFIGWTCGHSILPEYLLMVFKCMDDELQRLSWGSTVKTIGMPDVKRLVTPVPPRDEQVRIVQELDNRLIQMDVLIEKVKVQISAIIEYRSALISAAVTGQIDVQQDGIATEEAVTS